jgi:hypothetical protein
MVQSSFAGIHSKETSKDGEMGDRIEPILANPRSKLKPSIVSKDSKHKPSTDIGVPTSSELDYPLARDASNLSDPVKSESGDISAISELHDSESDESYNSESDESESDESESEANGRVYTRHDQGRENAQAYRLRMMSPDLRRKRAYTPRAKLVTKLANRGPRVSPVKYIR